MNYKNKRSFNNSVKNNTCCITCNRSGEKNPFYGKKHKKESIEKINIEKLKELINGGFVFISKPEVILKIFKNENQL